ncbi:hypothetical protein Tco_0561321 [Tanacetum coccineum]
MADLTTTATSTGGCGSNGFKRQSRKQNKHVELSPWIVDMINIIEPKDCSMYITHKLDRFCIKCIQLFCNECSSSGHDGHEHLQVSSVYKNGNTEWVTYDKNVQSTEGVMDDNNVKNAECVIDDNGVKTIEGADDNDVINTEEAKDYNNVSKSNNQESKSVLRDAKLILSKIKRHRKAIPLRAPLF